MLESLAITWKKINKHPTNEKRTQNSIHVEQTKTHTTLHTDRVDDITPPEFTTNPPLETSFMTPNS